MKTLVWIVPWIALCTAVHGQTVERPSPEVTGEAGLADARIEIPLQVESPTESRASWSDARNGVLGQFLQAPNPLLPINPAAPSEAGTGDYNLSRDTVTGRVMGLSFFKVEF